MQKTHKLLPDERCSPLHSIQEVSRVHTIEDVYRRLCLEHRNERYELSISDDKTILMLKLSDDLRLTADDDMIAVAKRKSLFGISYDSVDHTHYTDFKDLYQRLLTYLSADAT